MYRLASFSPPYIFRVCSWRAGLIALHVTFTSPKAAGNVVLGEFVGWVFKDLLGAIHID
jgi:hypothetical protein